LDKVERVLTTMRGSYVGRFKLTPDEEQAWREGIAGFDPRVLATATNHFRADHPDWPSTLMVFRRYCFDLIRKRDSADDALAQKYEQWAKENNLDGKKPEETVEQFQRRLVWQSECRKRGCSSAQLSEIAAANKAQNRKNEQAKKDLLRGE